MRQKSSAFRNVLRYIRPDWWLGILMILLAAGTVLLTLRLPQLFGEMIDGITDGSADIPISVPIRCGVIILATAFFQWLVNVLGNRIAYGTVKRLREDTFCKLQRLPLAYSDSHPIGETVSRIIADSDQISDGLLLGFTQFFTGIFTIVCTLVFMLSLNLRVAAVVILVTPLSLFAAGFIASKTHRLFERQSIVRAEETALADELITEHKTVAAFGREEVACREFKEVNDRLKQISCKALFFSSLVNPSTRFVNSLVYAGVALVGALLCISTGGAALTVGELSCFLVYANQYTKPFNEISGVVTELQNALACADRVFELLDAPELSAEADGAFPHIPVDGHVALEHVCFSYLPNQKLIDDLNLVLEPGKRAAIVGRTGCGKTTVINLLMRFYDPDSGRITVDGTDTVTVPRSQVRKSFGMVLQDTWLMSGTVRENLCFGKPDATDEEMISAARAAHADSFIRKLPNGYDTVLSEDGGCLSQGQKQLLCIARVMLCLPPMLILDEATSSIDTRTEMKIQRAFATLMQGRTSFLVAHRLSTIEDADIILVMNDGRISESGTHRELLARGGMYAALYHSQFETEQKFASHSHSAHITDV